MNGDQVLETVIWIQCETDRNIRVRGLRPGNFVRISLGDIGYVPANAFRKAWFRFENGETSTQDFGPVSIAKNGDTFLVSVTPKSGPARQMTLERHVGEEILERVAQVHSLLFSYRGLEDGSGDEETLEDEEVLTATA